MTPKEFIEKIDDGTAQMLTIAKARQLKGKKIAWMYFGYEDNGLQVYEMVVGDITTDYEYNLHEPCEGYSSRAEYWAKMMKPDKLQQVKNKQILLDNSGRDTYIFYDPLYPYFDEPTFVCSDVDRPVFFIEIN